MGLRGVEEEGMAKVDCAGVSGSEYFLHAFGGGYGLLSKFEG